jgi:hypothetical protein
VRQSNFVWKSALGAYTKAPRGKAQRHVYVAVIAQESGRIGELIKTAIRMAPRTSYSGTLFDQAAEGAVRRRQLGAWPVVGGAARGQIARFLHNHKDDGAAPNG